MTIMEGFPVKFRIFLIFLIAQLNNINSDNLVTLSMSNGKNCRDIPKVTKFKLLECCALPDFFKPDIREKCVADCSHTDVQVDPWCCMTKCTMEETELGLNGTINKVTVKKYFKTLFNSTEVKKLVDFTVKKCDNEVPDSQTENCDFPEYGSLLGCIHRELFRSCCMIIAVTASNAVKIRQFPLTGAINVFKRTTTIPVNIDPTSTCKNAQEYSTYCASEPSCSPNGGIFQCLPNGRASHVTKCSDQKPYCVGNGGKSYCSKEPASSGCPFEFYQCLGIGLYPEINDCRTYYNCTQSTDETEFIAKRVTCKNGFTFNPSTGCERGFCVRPTCLNLKMTLWRPLNYRNFGVNRMALLCVTGNPAVIYACPKNMQINVTSIDEAMCLFKCTPQTIKAPYLEDNSKYWSCNKGTAELKACDEGNVFDAEKLECVSDPTFEAALIDDENLLNYKIPITEYDLQFPN